MTWGLLLWQSTVFVPEFCLPTTSLAPDPPCAGTGRVDPGRDIKLALGGCTSNAGLDLAKAGVEGRRLRLCWRRCLRRIRHRTLKAGDVDTAGVHTVAGSGTASQTMVINVTGQDRALSARPGPICVFTVDHIPADWVRSPRSSTWADSSCCPG